MFYVRKGSNEWDVSVSDPGPSGYSVIAKPLNFDVMYNDLLGTTPMFQFSEVRVVARNSEHQIVPITYNILFQDSQFPVLYNNDITHQTWLETGKGSSSSKGPPVPIPYAGTTENQYQFPSDSHMTMHNVMSFMASNSINSFKDAKRMYTQLKTAGQTVKADSKIYMPAYGMGPQVQQGQFGGQPMQASAACYYQPPCEQHPLGMIAFPVADAETGMGINLAMVDDPAFKAIGLFLEHVRSDALPNVMAANAHYLIQSTNTVGCIPFTRQVVSSEFPPVCLGSDFFTQLAAIPIPMMDYIFEFYGEMFNLARTFVSIPRQDSKQKDIVPMGGSPRPSGKGLVLTIKTKYSISSISLVYCLRVFHGTSINTETGLSMSLPPELDQMIEPVIPDMNLLPATILAKNIKLNFAPSIELITPAVWHGKLLKF